MPFPLRALRPLRPALDGLLDLLWPCTCLACATPVLRPGFCLPCAELVAPRDGPRCALCDAGLPTAGPVHRCGRCLARAPRFAQAWGLFDYAGPVGDAIRAGKYRGRPDGLPSVARALKRCLPEALRADPPLAVVPVPLHPRRLHQRRVDAPLVLAAAVADALAVPLRPWVAVRHRDTPSQAGLSEVARRDNVRAAFQVRRTPPLDVLVVDDVMTTGATVDALSRALRRAGAERVRVLAAAAVERR